MAEIETDKATMGFETPEEGYLAKIVIQAGQKDITIGKLVCIIVENEADVAAFANFKDTGINWLFFYLINIIKKLCIGSPSPPPSAPAPAAAAPPPVAAAPPSSLPPPVSVPTQQSTGSRVYASPMAKRLAETQKLKLEGSIYFSYFKYNTKHDFNFKGKGSGLYGSITSKDLTGLKAAAPSVAVGTTAPSAGTASTSSGAAYVDVPVSSIRAVIAKRLLESKITIPHYYLTVDVNMDQVIFVLPKTIIYIVII